MFFPFLKKHALLSSFIFFSITAYLNGWLATNYPYYEKSNKQLYDVLFNYLTPPISRMYADTIFVLLTIYFVIRYLYKKTKVAIKFFVLIGILYVFRALTFTLTETPEPSRFQKTCKHNVTTSFVCGHFQKHVNNHVQNTCVCGHAQKHVNKQCNHEIRWGRFQNICTN